MEKAVIGAASFYAQKYYFNPEFNGIPKNAQDEIRKICITHAEKNRCIFSIGFYEDGELYLEANASETDYDYDEIGVPLEVKQLEKEKKELLDALKLWYLLFKKTNINI